jgi:uncharacterized protein with HEPN domain
LPFREVHAHLVDIREGIDNIDSFVKEMDFDAYHADLKTRSAVERQLQIISEAAVRLKDEGERLCPRIDWKGLCGMGNVLRHGYHKVEDRIVWDAVKFDLPLPKACVDRVLNTPATDSAGPALG